MENQIAHPIPILTSDQRIRVFISSTIQELQDERRGVAQGIRDLKLHPVMFEEGARPYPPRDVYRALLEQSHIYVGIFCKSYGWIAPDMSISGLEDEFNLSAGKPRLVYLKEAPDGRDPRLDKLIHRIEHDGTISYARFSTTDELVELVKNDIMQVLSERFGLSTLPRQDNVTLPIYLKNLKSDMDHRGPLISRADLIHELKDDLAARQILVVAGEPGTGKTYLLGALGSELDAIYVSLRNKSTQQVCSHLANHLAIRRHLFPRNLPSEDEARLALQQELANGTAVLLIDDVDQNLQVAEALRGMDFYANHVVFTMRSELDLFEGMAKRTVPSFTPAEVAEFLAARGISLPPGEAIRLHAASRGNPLYLYYFSQQPISPFPEGLREYQRSLWGQYSPVQQEIMNFIAFSFEHLTITDLHALINADHVVSGSIMETKRQLIAAMPILRQVVPHYEFFHPYFEEYVRSVATEDGLLPHYHQLLADHAIRRRRILPAAFHLLRANDPRMKEYLLSGSTAAVLRGDWKIAQELLEGEIGLSEQANDKHAEAYARYLLAQIHLETGRYDNARREVDRSIQLFGESGDGEWKKEVESWSSLLLIEEGRPEETIAILKKRLGDGHHEDPLKEAMVQLNLSFADIQASHFREGAEAAQLALDLFTRLDDERGIFSSLTNLAGCVGQLGQIDLQMKYAQQVIDAAAVRNLPRLRAAGLNHLAMAQRLGNNPIAAQHSLEEAIELCQQVGDIDAEIMNIANLGNAYLDQHLYSNAERAYLEALAKARENRLRRDEGHALELLGKLKHHQGLDEEAIPLLEEALGIARERGEHLRLATTLGGLGISYEKLGRNQSAAESYQESGDHYALSGLWGDAARSYRVAASMWFTIGNHASAFHCVSEGVRCAIQGSDPIPASDVLAELPRDVHNAQFGKAYLDILRLFLKPPVSVPFTHFMINFATHCKLQYDPAERAYFKVGLETLVSALTENPAANLLNALAIGIEQASEELLPSEELDSLAQRMADVVAPH